MGENDNARQAAENMRENDDAPQDLTGMEAKGNALQGGDNWSQFMRFDGKGLEYLVILLHKWLFSLLTLGIYSFWGKTRARKYLWSQTHVLGEALEYTGTGRELFVSFLIVVPCFMLFTMLLSYLGQHYPLTILAFYPLFLFLWELASYLSLRYRLTRTRWRGIRGNMSGSALSYAWRACLYWLAVFCSLGLLLPWASARMTAMKLNNAWFGDRKASFDGPARELVKIYLLCLGGGLLFMAAGCGSIAYVFTQVDLAFQNESTVVLIALGAYLFLLFGLSMIFAFYQALHFRWLCGHLTYGDINLRSTLTGKRLCSMHLSNMLIVVCTLGLGWAFALTRYLRLLCGSVDYQGDPALGQLLQDTMKAPTRGDGLLEALDVDISL
ncbi:DUF898 domain-containing protein [Desulfovibrio sp. OttesenSCG-928-G11]|nr:DUF898 domain-containing protein [Desulfovibrio sp. OttesenSCG-928-G11]